jgi:hypothetical protein
MLSPEEIEAMFEEMQRLGRSTAWCAAGIGAILGTFVGWIIRAIYYG